MGAILNSEIIVAAAVRYGDMIVTAPPPARHHTVLHGVFETMNETRPSNMKDQGFITSTGRFVERGEAWFIAMASGQPMIDHPSRIDGTLYSEDLW